MRARVALPMAAACMLALASCQSAAPRQAPPLPAGPQVVEVRLGDYRFDYDSSSIAGGRVLFRVTNAGTVAHSLTMLPLAEDIPPIDQQLRGSERRAIAPFAGVRARKPGMSTSFAVDLKPGRRYALVCFVTDKDGPNHALRGMSSEFRTVGAAAATTTSFPTPSS